MSAFVSTALRGRKTMQWSLSMGAGEFALGVLGMNDRDERHRGCDQRPERLGRREDCSEVLEPAESLRHRTGRRERRAPHPRESRRHDEGSIAGLVEPGLERGAICGDRRRKDLGCQTRLAGARPTPPGLLQRLIATGPEERVVPQARSAPVPTAPATARDRSHRRL